MVQRISERQSVLKLKLTAAQKKLLTTRCAAAQTKLQVLKTQDSTAAGKRQQIYSDLASRLEDIIVQLKVQGVDTTQLSTAQKNFNAAIDLYLADAMSYRAALDDAATIDCQTDPTGFEASLLSARQLRVQLAADVSKIKAIRPQLVKNLDSLKLQLSANTQRAGQ
jgi:hypothetical protein